MLKPYTATYTDTKRKQRSYKKCGFPIDKMQKLKSVYFEENFW